MNRRVLPIAIVGASAAALVVGFVYRSPLRLWALRTLAHGSPVMMNVTIDNGTVNLVGAKWGYMYRNTIIGAPVALRAALDDGGHLYAVSGE